MATAFALFALGSDARAADAPITPEDAAQRTRIFLDLNKQTGSGAGTRENPSGAADGYTITDTSLAHVLIGTRTADNPWPGLIYNAAPDGDMVVLAIQDIEPHTTDPFRLWGYWRPQTPWTEVSPGIWTARFDAPPAQEIPASMITGAETTAASIRRRTKNELFTGTGPTLDLIIPRHRDTVLQYSASATPGNFAPESLPAELDALQAGPTNRFFVAREADTDTYHAYINWDPAVAPSPEIADTGLVYAGRNLNSNRHDLVGGTPTKPGRIYYSISAGMSTGGPRLPGGVNHAGTRLLTLRVTWARPDGSPVLVSVSYQGICNSGSDALALLTSNPVSDAEFHLFRYDAWGAAFELGALGTASVNDSLSKAPLFAPRGVYIDGDITINQANGLPLPDGQYIGVKGLSSHAGGTYFIDGGVIAADRHQLRGAGPEPDGFDLAAPFDPDAYAEVSYIRNAYITGAPIQGSTGVAGFQLFDRCLWLVDSSIHTRNAAFKDSIIIADLDESDHVFMFGDTQVGRDIEANITLDNTTVITRSTESAADGAFLVGPHAETKTQTVVIDNLAWHSEGFTGQSYVTWRTANQLANLNNVAFSGSGGSTDTDFNVHWQPNAGGPPIDARWYLGTGSGFVSLFPFEAEAAFAESPTDFYADEGSLLPTGVSLNDLRLGRLTDPAPAYWQPRGDLIADVMHTVASLANDQSADPDLNNDGAANFLDTLAYLAAFDTTDPTADTDRNGQVVFEDLIQHLTDLRFSE